MAKVLADHQRSIKEATLIPSNNGRFEVVVNGELIYSKLETGQHLEEGKMSEMIGQYLADHS